MCTNLVEACEEINKMPYYQNYAAVSGEFFNGHEDAVESVFIKHDFLSVPVTDYPLVVKSLFSRWKESGYDYQILRDATEHMPNGSFISQPGGSNGFPDQLLKDYNGKLFTFEEKSVKKGTSPMYNDNCPAQETTYIFAKFKKGTTMFLGKDVITTKREQQLRAKVAAMKAIEEEFTEGEELDDPFNRGFVADCRQQMNQRGTGKINYFTHEDRFKCEANVLEFVK